MKTNLYKALNDKMALTIRLYARWLLRLIVLLFSVSLLSACVPKTEEEQLATINRQIAPDGHLTKTHLYVHWPAVYTKPRRNDPGGKEIVPAITLKIPLEYLGQNLISFENAAKIDLHDAGITKSESPTIDYSSRINQALRMHDHQITSIYLRLIPGAKPYVPMLPFKSDPPDVAQKKAGHFLNSYAVIIDKDSFFAIPLSERKQDVSGNKPSYEKPPRLDCIGDDFCHIRFGLKGRMSGIGGVGEGLDHPNLARFNQSNKSAKQPPSPSSNVLPKWHEKLDPAQILVNSFLLSEDSPEAKDIFPNPDKTSP
jgi:hypothetical protein